MIATAPITGWKFYGNLSEKVSEVIHAFGAPNNLVPAVHKYISGFIREKKKEVACCKKDKFSCAFYS